MTTNTPAPGFTCEGCGAVLTSRTAPCPYCGRMPAPLPDAPPAPPPDPAVAGLRRAGTLSTRSTFYLAVVMPIVIIVGVGLILLLVFGSLALAGVWR